MAAEGSLEFEVDKFWEKFKSNIENELIALAEQLTGLIQKNAPVAFNALSSSFTPVTEFTEHKAFIAVGSPLWFGAGGYGVYVELGTKPHWAPLEPLVRWVEHKIQPHVLAIGVEFTSGKAKPTRKGTKVLKGDARARAIQSLARAIQIKIAMKGTAAQHFVLKSIQEMGLQATLNDSGIEPHYEVDVAQWIEGQLPRIIGQSVT